MAWMTFWTPRKKRGANRPADEIYFLRAKISKGGLFGGSETLHKIGITQTSPEQRISEIAEDGGPRCQKVFSAMRPDAGKLEKTLHKKFAAKNVNFKTERFPGIKSDFNGHTEFFRLSSSDAEEVRRAFGNSGQPFFAFQMPGEGMAFVYYTAGVLMALMYAKIQYFP